MKSLCEDGFRTYGKCENITFKNCIAKNTRGGFELRFNKAHLENCETIGTERGYWVGDGTVVKNCKGDANYGPLLFVEGSNIDVDLIVDAAESDRVVHALATIQGADNTIVLRSEKGTQRKSDLPILLGYTHPEHGEAMSPYSQALTTGLMLTNKTGMPIEIGEEVKKSTIKTNGKILENKGAGVKVSKI
ncbi:hypothetical protein [Formosa sp. PL04]|uniref:hypothetical protein n=1 Tax=Formosa sp. PL04 TaxID=3081755 RepID=UPI00298213AA|nr:hypothetical protein [Formosa sp. PL04]MDW5290301.1 hypothetical protein [Formosa sp. PL04]